MRRSLSLFILLLSVAGNVRAAAVERSLDGDWLFSRPNVPARTVRVPHDWAIEGPFDPEGDADTGKLPWRGKGLYRRTFDLTADEAGLLAQGGRAYLAFDGVMANAWVTLNGRSAGGWDYGYTGFTLDVTDFVRRGMNDLQVACDTSDHKSRWYPGAGLYRSVKLLVKAADGIVPGTVRIVANVNWQDGRAVSATVEAEWTRAKSGRQRRTLTMERPHLWDVDDPHLYEIELDGERFRYGIRSAVWTADDGFHLNGRRLQLQGVNLHADLGPLGMAFNRSAARRQLAIMREMGVNAIRTSHNPPAAEFLDLCDEMGFVVWEEAFDKWNGTSGRKEGVEQDPYVIRHLQAMVRRDRNHPSVVVWSIGNEIHPTTDAGWEHGMSRARLAAYRAAVLAEDASRKVAIGCCHPWAVDGDSLADIDLTGWNYQRRYRRMREKYPEKPLVYTESASALSCRGFYQLPSASNRCDYAFAVREVDSYDRTAACWSDIPDVEFFRMETDRHVAGEFVWTGFDYLGEPTPYVNWYLAHVGLPALPARETARSSYFGIVDLCGQPKDRYYLYRSLWNRRAHTCHLVPSHWNFAASGRVTLPVFVYTDGDEAELFLNGRSLGRRRKATRMDYPVDFEVKNNEYVRKSEPGYYDVTARYRLCWDEVAYEPGVLKAVAYRGGARIGADEIRTAGLPVEVRLEPEATRLDETGEELAFVKVTTVDARGVRVPEAATEVRFAAAGAGEIVAVGNGDPRGLASFADVRTHRLWHGSAYVIVRGRGCGSFVLTASADGLQAARQAFVSGRRQSLRTERDFERQK